MTKKELTKKSKFLSLVLRHRPELIGIQLDEQAWVSVDELIQKCNAYGKKYDLPSLQYIVEINNKKRFAFSDDGKRIRANQGHSIKIDLGYKAKQPPQFLYHGTATRFISSISQQGLHKRNRHHVHLTDNIKTAKQVGQRHGKPVVLIVKAQEMYEAGIEFFLSENGVWLTDHVAVEYLDFSKMDIVEEE